jgi:hypothetical protein
VEDQMIVGEHDAVCGQDHASPEYDRTPGAHGHDPYVYDRLVHLVLDRLRG